MSDKESLLAVLRELSNLLLSEETLRSSLQRVAFLSVQAIEPCDAAGVSVLAGSEVVTAAGSDENVDALDELQYRTGEGPCLQAIREGRILTSDSVAEDPRWPKYAQLAARHRVMTCLAVPLIEDGRTFGALNLYSYRDRRFDAVAEESAVALAAQASGPLSNMRRYANLRQAASRLSEQTDSQVPLATGVLMERNCCSREEATRFLTRMAAEGKKGMETAALGIVLSATKQPMSRDDPLVGPPPKD